MKDQLLDRAPTIGDLRRQGVAAIEIRCARPCKHIGSLDLDRLHLPDDAIFDQIPKLRNLVCTACDRRVAVVAPTHPPQDVPRLGERRRAEWTVILVERGRELISSPLWSRTEAFRFAQQEIAAGNRVVRIEGPAETIFAEEIAAWHPDDGRG